MELCTFYRHCGPPPPRCFCQTPLALSVETRRSRDGTCDRTVFTLTSRRQYLKIGNSKKEIHFLLQRHALSMSFDIFVITHRVTNFLLKLVDICFVFHRKKTGFPFFDFPIFGCCPSRARFPGRLRVFTFMSGF